MRLHRQSAPGLGQFPPSRAGLCRGRAGPPARSLQRTGEPRRWPGPRRTASATSTTGRCASLAFAMLERYRALAGAALPGAEGSNSRRGAGRFPLLGRAEGGHLSAPAPPRRCRRHRGHGAGHGLRQCRRRFRLRGRLHPRPGHRLARPLRRLRLQRPGRGRGRRPPAPAMAAPGWAACCPACTRACRRVRHAGGAVRRRPGLRVHPASGPFWLPQRVPPSARPGRRCASRWNWSRKGCSPKP